MTKRDRRDQSGFTMVELLIVVLILGVLAAIAMPTYLNQKHRGFDAQMKSVLREVATSQETYVVDHPQYTTIATLVADGARIAPAQGVGVRLLRYAGEGYCLEASHVRSARRWFWDSKAGGLQPAGAPGCPQVTSGAAGDSRP